MKAEAEITEIFGHLRRWIGAHRDMGFDPPPLSDEVLDYLMAVDHQIAPLQAKGPHSPGGGLEPGAQPATLEDLSAFMGQCKGCRLHRNRTHLVFGEGSPQAELVFVGEGPGQEEDMAGRPFVGEAGRLLTKIIENGMRLARKEVYICNVVKCRPPRNRDPKRDEIEACLPFLEQQLKIIRPKVICTLGRVAGQSLTGKEFSIRSERGKWYTHKDIPLMPTFHPAYLLRNPSAKRQVWEDIQKIMRRLGMEVKRNEG